MNKGDRHAAFSYPYGASPTYPSVLIGSLLAAAENVIRRLSSTKELWLADTNATVRHFFSFPKDMYPAP
jgi:hypothetical protein